MSGRKLREVHIDGQTWKYVIGTQASKIISPTGISHRIPNHLLYGLPEDEWKKRNYATLLRRRNRRDFDYLPMEDQANLLPGIKPSDIKKFIKENVETYLDNSAVRRIKS